MSSFLRLRCRDCHHAVRLIQAALPLALLIGAHASCPAAFTASLSCTLPEGSVCSPESFSTTCSSLEIYGTIDVGFGTVDILTDSVTIGGTVRGRDIRISTTEAFTILTSGLVDASGLGWASTPSSIDGAGSRRRRRVRHDYGNSTYPTTMGHGHDSYGGAHGGGRILLESCGMLTIDGSVRSDGGVYGYGGSSPTDTCGGSVLAMASVIAGAGTLQAASYDSYWATAGDGGLVAIHAQAFGEVMMSAAGAPSSGQKGSTQALALKRPLDMLHFPRWGDASPAPPRPACGANTPGAHLPGACARQLVDVGDDGAQIEAPAMQPGGGMALACPPGKIGSVAVRCEDGITRPVDGGVACSQSCSSGNRRLSEMVTLPQTLLALHECGDLVHGNKITLPLPCPQGYEGNAAVLCEDGVLRFDGEATCSMTTSPSTTTSTSTSTSSTNVTTSTSLADIGDSETVTPMPPMVSTQPEEEIPSSTPPPTPLSPSRMPTTNPTTHARTPSHPASEEHGGDGAPGGEGDGQGFPHAVACDVLASPSEKFDVSDCAHVHPGEHCTVQCNSDAGWHGTPARRQCPHGNNNPHQMPAQQWSLRAWPECMKTSSKQMEEDGFDLEMVGLIVGIVSAVICGGCALLLAFLQLRQSAGPM